MPRKYKSRAKKQKRSKIRKNRSRFRTKARTRSRKIKRYLGGSAGGPGGGADVSEKLTSTERELLALQKQITTEKERNDTLLTLLHMFISKIDAIKEEHENLKTSMERAAAQFEKQVSDLQDANMELVLAYSKTLRASVVTNLQTVEERINTSPVMVHGGDDQTPSPSPLPQSLMHSPTFKGGSGTLTPNVDLVNKAMEYINMFTSSPGDPLARELDYGDAAPPAAVDTSVEVAAHGD